MARKGDIEILFIALPMSDNIRIANILKVLGDTTVVVHIVPDMFTYNLLQARMATWVKYKPSAFTTSQ
jgi:putative colanic acid biosynthesis UDP-glucose lipid carrier transferase